MDPVSPAFAHYSNEQMRVVVARMFATPAYQQIPLVRVPPFFKLIRLTGLTHLALN